MTVYVPIDSADSTYEQDLAVIREIMKQHQCVEPERKHAWGPLMHAKRNNEPKENLKGDLTWSMWAHEFLQWVGIDPETAKPVEKYVHPVKFDTGHVERKRLMNLLKKKGPSEHLQMRLDKLDNKENDDDTYHWAAYEQCLITFKKKQTRKQKHKELQLTVKIRTFDIGVGDPKKHNGYMLMSSNLNLRDMDPTSDMYRMITDSPLITNIARGYDIASAKINHE